MSDKPKPTPDQQDTNDAEDQSEQPGQQFNIQKIYVKDASFESPHSPDIFTKTWEPSVNIELNSNGKLLSDNVHEVVLKVTVTAKIEEQVAYLIEIQQAGIFTLAGFDKPDLAAMLGSYCPNVLYPYVREVISDLLIKGGYPQMLLAPVNFEAIYQDHLKQQASQEQSSDSIH